MPPLSPDATRLIWCLRYPWARAYEPADATWDSGDWYHMSRLHADLTSERPYPKRGAYGMHIPHTMVILAEKPVLKDVKKDEVRWLVTGGPTPIGRYAMLFDSVKLGDDGQPHPRGMYHVTHEAADALWEASNAVSV